MLSVKISGKVFVLDTSLGTVRKIEAAAGKSLSGVVNNADRLTVDDMLTYMSLASERPEEFVKAAYGDEAYGQQDVFDTFVKFQYALRYPGKTAEEAEDIEAKKVMRAQERAAELLRPIKG